MSNQLPNDPVLCLSVVNTNLRDFYPSLDEFCKSLQIDKEDLICKLKNIDYHYDAIQNQFI